MNYNDQLLENKPFNFTKQLVAYIAYAICAILVVALLASWLFGVGYYRVASGSEEPYIMTGDMIVVVPQKSYKVGDILEFKEKNRGSEISVTHRLIAILEDDNGVKHYICHGDNNQAANPHSPTHLAKWQDDAKYIQDLEAQGLTYEEIIKASPAMVQHVQDSTFDEIGGKVLFNLYHYGDHFVFIRNHAPLFITMVIGLWIISTVVSSELEIKRNWRLM